MGINEHFGPKKKKKCGESQSTILFNILSNDLRKTTGAERADGRLKRVRTTLRKGATRRQKR